MQSTPLEIRQAIDVVNRTALSLRSQFGQRIDALMDTLVRLSSWRSGFRAWEYDFSYAGSQPLWVSAMTQATAAQALARGCRSSSVNTCRTWYTVTAGVFPPQPPPLQLQEPQR